MLDHRDPVYRHIVWCTEVAIFHVVEAVLLVTHIAG
ncbi:Uncharacterised protein [Vibrio cholerae]|nr:Uncharacterised protein [Vibrio cholerae]